MYDHPSDSSQTLSLSHLPSYLYTWCSVSFKILSRWFKTTSKPYISTLWLVSGMCLVAALQYEYKSDNSSDESENSRLEFTRSVQLVTVHLLSTTAVLSAGFLHRKWLKHAYLFFKDMNRLQELRPQRSSIDLVSILLPLNLGCFLQYCASLQLVVTQHNTDGLANSSSSTVIVFQLLSGCSALSGFLYELSKKNGEEAARPEYYFIGGNADFD